MKEIITLSICMLITALIFYALGNSKGYDKGWKAGAESQIILNDANEVQDE